MENLQYSLNNPFKENKMPETKPGIYDDALGLGKELIEKPFIGGGEDRIRVQHSKNRMTVWERIKVLTDEEPNITYQNWGPNLDGASIVTGILKIRGRDVAVYGHDFTLRAGSMDATNGSKLARLIQMAGEHG
ncbi:carboxyl transferase domain-containing protein, partial [Leptospira sp. 96542]|nr:carboxyl transferase domain-containing protein [Leptospira sp. 96542]